MSNPVEYQLAIESKELGVITQIWQWYGEKKGDLKALCNHVDYASDTRIYIDESNNIAGGYCYLVNSETSIKVTRLLA